MRAHRPACEPISGIAAPLVPAPTLGSMRAAAALACGQSSSRYPRPLMTNPAHADRRWPVISALGVVMIFTWGSSYYLMAVLAGPIAADTGWPLAWIMGALSAGLLAAGLIAPTVGRAITRHGGRPVLATGCLLLASGLIVIALAPALWVFFTGWLLLGLGMAAGLYDPAFASLGRLYGRDARGPITVLTLWGGFASTVCWPLSALMLEAFGWRGTAAAYAAIHLCVTLPLVLVFIPRATPPADGKITDTAKPPRLEGMERTVFLLMAAILVIVGLIVVNISTYLFTFLQAQGMSLAAAVALGTLFGPAQVGARVLEMAGRGRHHPIWTMAASTLSVGSGLTLLALDLGLAALAVILYGCGNGLFSIARGSLPLAFFGPERYALIMGTLARPALIAQAAAPMLGAALIGRWGTGETMVTLAVLAAVNVGLMIAMWRLVRRPA